MKNQTDKGVLLQLGDERLNKRYKTIILKNTKQPSQSIPSTFKNYHQTKAVYRFFDNPKITAEKLLGYQNQVTLERIKEGEDEKDILVLQDTTHLNYHRHDSKKRTTCLSYHSSYPK